MIFGPSIYMDWLKLWHSYYVNTEFSTVKLETKLARIFEIKVL